MFQLLKTLLWLRFRLLSNALRHRRRRGWRSWGDLGNALGPALIFLIFLPVTLGLSGLGLYAGWASGRMGIVPPEMLDPIRAILAASLLGSLVLRLSSSDQGWFSVPERFLLLPVEKSALYWLQLFSGMGDPIFVSVVPALTFFSLGLSLSGRLSWACLTLLLATSFALFLLAFQSTLDLGLHVLFRNRRRAEYAGLFIALFIISLVSLSAILGEGGWGAAMGSGASRLFVALSNWTPPGIYSWSLSSLRDTRGTAGILGSLMIALEGLALAFVGQRFYFKILEHPPSNRSNLKPMATFRFQPCLGISGQSWAVAQALVLDSLRSVRGRMALILTPILVALVTLTAFAGTEEALPDLGINRQLLLAPLAFLFGLLSLQPVLVNLFGSVGRGSILEFLAPILERDLALGKLLGAALLSLINFSLGLAIVLLLEPSISGQFIFALLTLGTSVLAVVLPAALVLSAFFPKVVDLGKVGQAGHPNQLAALIASFLTLAALAIPVFLATFSLFALEEASLVWGVLLVWTLLALLTGFVITGYATRLVKTRKEEILLTLEGD